MDLEQLESFVCLTEEKSFSKAAERMFITQSTMSNRIQKMENELGVALFSKRRREVTLSAFGTSFLPHAKQCIKAIYEGKKAIEIEKQKFDNNIRIGVTYPFATFILPYLVAEIYKHFPEERVEILRARSPEEITKMIELYQIDVGFVNKNELSSRLNEQFVYEDIVKDRLVLALKQTHPLTKYHEVTLPIISKQQFVMLNSDNAISQLIHTYFLSHGKKPVNFIEINSVDAIKYIVKTTNMLTFLPEMIIQEDKMQGELIVLPITPELPYFEMSMIYEAKSSSLNMIKFVRSKLQSIIQSGCNRLRHVK